MCVFSEVFQACLGVCVSEVFQACFGVCVSEVFQACLGVCFSELFQTCLGVCVCFRGVSDLFGCGCVFLRCFRTVWVCEFLRYFRTVWVCVFLRCFRPPSNRVAIVSCLFSDSAQWVAVRRRDLPGDVGKSAVQPATVAASSGKRSIFMSLVSFTFDFRSDFWFLTESFMSPYTEYMMFS